MSTSIGLEIKYEDKQEQNKIIKKNSVSGELSSLPAHRLSSKK